MTQPGPPAFPPPPPPPPGGPPRMSFDAAFVGPLLPPRPPATIGPVGAAPPPVSDAVLAIPLGTRRLVSTALDLLTRSDAGLRSASFYIGLVMLLTIGPVAAITGLAWVTLGEDAFGPTGEPGSWTGWLALAMVPAVLGYVAASVDARILAVAVIGGRAEGRPLQLRESIAVVRRRFWRVLGAEILVGIVSTAASWATSTIVESAIGVVDPVEFAVSLVVSLAVGAPFVYVTAGIVLGEVGVVDAIRRSFALVWARKQLAVVVTLFGVLSQFIILLGLSAGLDAAVRVGIGAGLDRAFPPALVMPIAGVLVFALGTLTFTVEAIAAAPAVFAFEALTHYTRGLDLGRREPLATRRFWQPYVTPGLALCAGIALLALIGAVASLPL